MNDYSINVENEVYDIVDSRDHVIGQATRKHIHENKLLHRSIHILVFNSQRKLFLQKRALSKDESPGLWDTSSAGHLDAGESYIDCAHRELFEELGLKAVLIDLIRIPACQETHGEHVQVYTCVTDDKIYINQDEISEGAFYNIPQVRILISLNPQEFTSSFKMLFEKLDEFENSIFSNKITI